MAKTAAAGVRADFVNYHDYPRNGAAAWDSATTKAQEDCLNHMTDANGGYGAAAGTCTLTAGSCTQTANGAFGVDQSEVLAWETKYYGTTVPTGISEYNFDPGSTVLPQFRSVCFLGRHGQISVSLGQTSSPPSKEEGEDEHRDGVGPRPGCRNGGR